MLLSILSTLGLRFSLIVIHHLCIHGPMQNLAETCSTPFLFGIPACIIQSCLFTSSKHYSLKSRLNVYCPWVTRLLGAHALLYPCENIHQNQTQVFGPKCIYHQRSTYLFKHVNIMSRTKLSLCNTICPLGSSLCRKIC